MTRTPRLRVLDLFSGVGGFSLGLERTGGFKTVAFCEIEPYPQRVLRRHWPEVPIYNDIRTLTASQLAADEIQVEVICGGFPCQDISLAGKGTGLRGKRSSLWFEFARLAGELRPRYVIVENVAALRSRGLDRVLGDLAEIGFDAEWHCIPASAVGAPHRRDRFWLVAYPNDGQCHGSIGALCTRGHAASGGSEDMADADSAGLEIKFNGFAGELKTLIGAHEWPTEPNVGRMAHGVPSRVDRLKSLGNSLVSQIPELIGRAILAYELSEAT